MNLNNVDTRFVLSISRTLIFNREEYEQASKK